MTNGALYDLYALAFGLLMAGLFGLAFVLAANHGKRPFDWERDAPEFRVAKDAHVRKLDW